MQEQIFSTTDKIGEIVARVPKAGEIFKEKQIDFCCGGSRPLVEAIKEKGLDEKELLAELEDAYRKTKELQEKQKDWRTAPLSELIDYIVSTHHAYLEKTLPVLSELTTTILRVHGTNHQELSRVHKLFHILKMDLEQHLITEEQILFPAIKKYEKNPAPELLEEAGKTISKLETEHEDAGKILKELRSITDHYRLPQDACPTFTKAYSLLQELEDDVFRHIHLENNILHPRLLQKTDK